ncbi:MAG: hypothetical protein KKD83_01875 [Chloroflexi bacterium]|nr:hypothetical protein [Chloroflexota bacterium]
MKPQHHALIGGTVALALTPALGVNSAVFWVSSVLIDGDHYVDYVYRNGFKDYSIKRMFEFHDLLSERGKEPDFLSLNLMHTAEFILLMSVAAAITGWTWLIAMLGGILLHMLLDLFYMYRHGQLFKRALSIIEYFVRWRRMKRQGLRPELHYQSVLESMFGRQDRSKTR